MKIPNRIRLAHLPTPIEEISRLDLPSDIRLFLKRDDFTGIEVSGNKVRKLEFLLDDAIRQGCDTLITCGGLQSNHARATAAVAAKLGLKCILVLRTASQEQPEGNLLLDHLFGADIRLVTPEDFSQNLDNIMQQLADEVDSSGGKAYLIPLGASNPLGTFGYFHAMEEILQQEKELDMTFDTIVCTVGSAGTYAGLVFANQLLQAEKHIVGINISDSADHFRNVTMSLWEGFCQILGIDQELMEPLHILDGFVGRGYALNTPEEMKFIRDIAGRTGIVFDPVYTGKAMLGLVTTLKQHHPLFSRSNNILFIHTGGLYGLFPKTDEFSDLI